MNKEIELPYEVRELNPSELSSIENLLNESLYHDKPFSEQLVNEKIFGDNRYLPELSLGAYVGKNLVGCISAVCDNDKPRAWIKLIAVSPEGRNIGVGGKLLGVLEKELKNKTIETVSVMDSTENYFMPGLDYRYTEAVCFFQKHGYEKSGENINLITDLAPDQYDVSEAIENLRNDGIQIKRAEVNDHDSVIRFLKDKFPEWIPEVETTFKNDPVTLFVSIMNGRVTGFSAYDSNNIGVGWFGPLGVDASMRGKGIGGILTQLCLIEQAKQGHTQSIIPWVGPIRFYSKICNSRIDRVFWVFRKQL